MDRLGCTPWSGLHARQLSALAHTVVILHADPLRTWRMTKTVSRGRETSAKRVHRDEDGRSWQNSRDLALCGTDAMIAVQGSMVASPVASSMGLNTLLSRPVISTESKTQFSEPSTALAQPKLFCPRPWPMPHNPVPINMLGNKRGDT